MATTFKYITGAFTTIGSAEFNSLANGGSAKSSAWDNGPANSGYFWANFEFFLMTSPNNPNSGSAVDLYLYPALDGTNTAQTGVYLVPQNYAGSFVIGSGTAQRLVLMGVPIPPTKFMAVIRNGAGQAFSAASSVLSILPYTDQGV